MNETTQRATNSALYRAIWRWHFIAGLLILPLVILLAVTGGIYLFKDEINDAAYSRLRLVDPATTQMLPPSVLTANALESHPGTLRAYAPPAAPDRAAEVKIADEDGIKDTIYVNPYSGKVLGSLWDGGAAGTPAMYVIRKLHSLEYVGWFGNRMIEVAAGWMVLLTGTGIYLWWPRGKKLGTVSVRATRGRPWWRDIHAVTGFYVSAFILFLAITGLPWTGVWGSKFYDLSYAVGLGMPDGYWSNLPKSSVPTGDALDRTPWIMGKQPMPQSGTSGGVPAGLDQVVATVEGLGIAPGYALNMPSGAEGVFSASVYPDDITQERVIHLDQYTGKVLYDASLSDLGVFGQIAEWGNSIHMGQAWGLPNQIVLLLACVAIVMLVVSGGVMWWKRRPKGSMGVPRMPTDWRIPRTLLLVAVVSGLFFPLVGLTMLVMAVIELAIYFSQKRKPQTA